MNLMKVAGVLTVLVLCFQAEQMLTVHTQAPQHDCVLTNWNGSTFYPGFTKDHNGNCVPDVEKKSQPDCIGGTMTKPCKPGKMLFTPAPKPAEQPCFTIKKLEQLNCMTNADRQWDHQMMAMTDELLSLNDPKVNAIIRRSKLHMQKTSIHCTSDAKSKP